MGDRIECRDKINGECGFLRFLIVVRVGNYFLFNLPFCLICFKQGGVLTF